MAQTTLRRHDGAPKGKPWRKRLRQGWFPHGAPMAHGAKKLPPLPRATMVRLFSAHGTFRDRGRAQTMTAERTAERLPNDREVRDDPVEHQRAQWRLASSRRRQRKEAKERVFRTSLPEYVVVGALLAKFPDQEDRLIDHGVCEILLARLVKEHLWTVIHDLPNGELKVDLARMLRDFSK